MVDQYVRDRFLEILLDALWKRKEALFIIFAIILIHLAVAPHFVYTVEKVAIATNSTSRFPTDYSLKLKYNFSTDIKENMSQEARNTIIDKGISIVPEDQLGKKRIQTERDERDEPFSNLKRKDASVHIFQSNKSASANNQILVETIQLKREKKKEYLLGYSSNPFDENYVPRYRVKEASRENASGAHRKKRSVLHLYNMVSCATGCNPLAYKGYGCYCGFLGSGYVVDGIDRCCKMHDWCYETADCPMFLEYFIPYLWKCYRSLPLCAIDHGDYGGPGSCAQRLCECDRQLAQCLRRYPCPSTKAICTSSPWRLLQNIFML